MTKKTRAKSKLSRKEFISWLWGISLFGLIGQATTALLKFFRPRITPGLFGGEVDAGAFGEFEPGTVNYVRKGRFYISRLEDGGLLALWQRCPHLGCTVPWREDLGQFHCPCHSSLFNTKGEVLGGPAPRPLDLFPISVQEGNIVVDTSQAIERQAYDPSQSFHID